MQRAEKAVHQAAGVAREGAALAKALGGMAENDHRNDELFQTYKNAVEHMTSCDALLEEVVRLKMALDRCLAAAQAIDLAKNAEDELKKLHEKIINIALDEEEEE